MKGRAWSILPRRFLTLMFLLFWQGGFLFYVSVVVPVGTSVLGSAKDQGFITRGVTQWMNVSGGVALAVMALDVICTMGESRWGRRGRWSSVAIMAIFLIALVVLHRRMDAYLDPEIGELLNRRAFYPLHRIYLWVSTFQWVFGLAYLGLTLRAWRQEDWETAAFGRVNS